MEKEEPDIDDVRLYLLGQMEEADKEAFEHKLAQDPEFRRVFNLNKNLIVGMEYHFDKTLKEKLSQEDRKNSAFLVKVKVSVIAATVLVLATVSYLTFMNPASPDKLFEQYYKPYYNVVDEIQRGDDSLNVSSAYRMYEQKKYREAIILFDSALQHDENNPVLRFYNGVSYLSQDDLDQAITNLKIAAISSDKFSEPATWYLGLAYLKKKDMDQAKIIFEEISKGGSNYKVRATEILEEL